MSRFFEIVPPSFLILITAMVCGYLTKRMGWLPETASRSWMVFIQKFVTPWVLVISLWGLELKSLSYVALALAGLLVIAFQMTLAAIAVRLLGLQGTSRGAFLVAAALSNIGYLGWFINLQLFGKPGYDYAFTYGFYFTFAVYVIAYPIAARYSTHQKLKDLPFFKRIFVENILFFALGAIAIGILLNLSPIERPAALGGLNRALVATATTILMFAAGLSVRVRTLRNHLGPSLTISVIKLFVTPLVVAWVVSAFFPGIDSVAAKVIVVESMMPLAISCLTVSAIFDLDQDLMNAMWLSTTVLFFVVFQAALIFFHVR